MKNKVAIAIDGPSGAGKGTVAKLVAQKLKILYVDTGAMYRAVGVYAIKNSINYKVKEEIENVLEDINIELKTLDGVQRVYLNKEDITDIIRTEEASIAASSVAIIPKVREKLVLIQQNIAKNVSVVMEGRDIGTRVLPNANLKIYLTATPEERAKRRYYQLKRKNGEVNYEKVLQDVIWRDKNDKERECDPLKQADDAIIIDNTNKIISDVVDEIIELLRRKTYVG